MEKESFVGALIEVDPSNGYVTDAYICAGDDQEAAVIVGAVARIMAPYHWSWLRGLLSRKKKQTGGRRSHRGSAR